MKKVLISLVLSCFLCLFSPLFVSSVKADLAFGFSARSLEEYNKYVAEEELDRSFIPYEKLSFLGEFASFHKGFPFYTYFFKAENGERVRFELKEGNCMDPSNDYFKIMEIDPSKEGTLLGLTAEVKSFLEKQEYNLCFFLVDDALFVYEWNYKVEDMVLAEIRWYSEEKASTDIIHLNEAYRNPFTAEAFDSGFYAEITDLSTWPKARARLMQATGDVFGVSEDDLTNSVEGDSLAITDNAPASAAPFPWLWVIVSAGAVLIIAAIAVLFIRKKKTQK